VTVSLALSVTSKIKLSNSSILEFKVLQNACKIKEQGLKYTQLCGLTIDSIIQNFMVFFPEALTRVSKTNAYMGHLL
jgi:hypothetical protein